MKQEFKSVATLRSVQRGLRILKLFSKEKPVWGVTEIANKLQLNKTSVSRVIGDLMLEGFLQKEKNKYCLGFSLLSLSGVMMSHLELHRESKVTIGKLVDEWGETAHIAVLEGTSITYVHKMECRNPVLLLSDIGKRNPVSCTSSGKVLLAFQKDDVIKAVIEAGLPQFGPNSVTDEVLFRKQLHTVKHKGYSVCINEMHDDVVSIASPIRDFTGEVVAAISIVGTNERIDDKKIELLTQDIIAAGEEISERLGYIPAAFKKELH